MRSTVEIEKTFPYFSRLHGYWASIPSFNPTTVSSYPGQDLGHEAQELLFPTRQAAGSHDQGAAVEGQHNDYDYQDEEHQDSCNMILNQAPNTFQTEPATGGSWAASSSHNSLQPYPHPSSALSYDPTILSQPAAHQSAFRSAPPSPSMPWDQGSTASGSQHQQSFANPVQPRRTSSAGSRYSPYPHPDYGNPSPITPLADNSPAITPLRSNSPAITPQSGPSRATSSRLAASTSQGRGSSAPPLGARGRSSRQTRAEDQRQIQMGIVDDLFTSSLDRVDRKKEREHERKLQETVYKTEKIRMETLKLRYTPEAIQFERDQMSMRITQAREEQQAKERLLNLYIQLEKTKLQVGCQVDSILPLPPPPPPPLMDAGQFHTSDWDGALFEAGGSGASFQTGGSGALFEAGGSGASFEAGGSGASFGAGGSGCLPYD